MTRHGHQNIRKVEDQAIAKADRYARQKYTSRSEKFQEKDKDTGVWRYSLINGIWQTQIR